MLELPRCGLALLQASRAWSAEREWNLTRRIEDQLRPRDWQGDNATYANQRDYNHNTPDFDLDYWGGDVAGAFDIWTAKASYEVLEGNGVRGFTTPLATTGANTSVTGPLGVMAIAASIGLAAWLRRRPTPARIPED